MSPDRRASPARETGAPPPARRRGRRPGDPERTRQAILEAARRTFAATGFDRSTIRSIAAEAGVDPALVLHHFRSKDGLFAAAHRLPFEPGAVLDGLATLPPEQRGEALARAVLTAAAAPESPLTSLLTAAATHEAAATTLREFVEATVFEHGRPLVSGPAGELRLALASAQLIGIAVHRHVLRLPQLADASLDQVVAAVAPTIQHYLDGPHPGP